jgi:hypothetical protein
MRAQMPLEQELEALERALLEHDVRVSGRVGELLADGFVEFGSSGRVWTRAEVEIALRDAAPSPPIAITGFAVRLLAADVALVTYRARRDGDPPGHSLRSSIWQLIAGRWQVVFHQGTPAAAP